MRRSVIGGILTLMVSLAGASCGSSTGIDGGAGANDSGNGNGTGSGNGTGNGNGNGTGTPRELISVPQIPGGGENAAPLAAGCGPETAQDCVPPGGGCDNRELLGAGDVDVIDAGSTCFFGEGAEDPAATIEYITEAVAEQEYVHLRVIFDPNFADTTYGECSLSTGWNRKKGHTFKDLKGSDHVELMLYNCADELSMQMNVDFIDDGATTACGYASAGVTGGDGKMIVGDAKDVLAVSSSLDRNMNGCGYCELEESPCPGGDGYAPSIEAPEWDFRVVYELWIDAAAFGASGFCRPHIEAVHASPSKAANDTVIVKRDDCPPPPGGDCPPKYELFLSSEGEYLCAGPPDQGTCADGFTLDLTSEGQLCVPE